MADEVDKHSPSWHPADRLEFQAPEDADGLFSFASDMYSVAVTLFEMATGELPQMRLDRDQLLAAVDDLGKRELISFALHADPAKRPTAEHLLQMITALAPSSMLESQFRAQVFASMRFSAIGPMAEAKLLRGKLASQGVHLHIISLLAGESITNGVFDTMAKCDAFIAMATKDVRVACCRSLLFVCSRSFACRHTVRTRHEQPRGDVSRSARVARAVCATGQAAHPTAHGERCTLAPRHLDHCTAPSSPHSDPMGRRL